MNEVLDAKLGHLWSGVIKHFAVDLWRHQITLDVELSPGGLVERHKLVFDRVAAFYYVADEGSHRHEPRNIDVAEGDILEASEVGYVGQRPPLIQIVRTSKEGLPNWPSTPNFYIEMHSSVFMIEADSVKIDGQHFPLGYPR